jgi:hypothetical protein
MDIQNRLVSDTMLNVIEAFLLGGYYRAAHTFMYQ